ncbi:type VII secretion protein EccB [Corynebacterium sp. HS2168-gen11]|uniref:type VII secretion protein EccB n=1 Tax=Corynebacterium sp. HS2168-gen11 TaxID=2974027 RepID=UPI00216B1B33|nr:type VII secretion protein EccB [Corynebacterium sp. HS2168-gen11]MCS4535656.1 type VII secretion protein EccB [Corynebacterium sp. HS2168-gen11]
MGLTPTTKAQLSGLKFLKRRLEHALIFGDTRMIVDPIRPRKKALIVGTILSVIVAIGSLALAVLMPKPDPGQHEFVRSESGQLYLRLNNQLHQIRNTTSARLLLGSPVVAKPVNDELLTSLDMGETLGIADAPDFLPTEHTVPITEAMLCDRMFFVHPDRGHAEHAWAMIFQPAGSAIFPRLAAPRGQNNQQVSYVDDGMVMGSALGDIRDNFRITQQLAGTDNAAQASVAEAPGSVSKGVSLNASEGGVSLNASEGGVSLNASEGGVSSVSNPSIILVRSMGHDYLVDANGRYSLPDPTSAIGRVLRRELGISSDTARWELPPEVLETIEENSAFAAPALQAVVSDGTDYFGQTPAGLVAISPFQAQIVLATGLSLNVVDEATLATFPTDTETQVYLPTQPVAFLDPTDHTVCIHARGTVSAFLREQPHQGSRELAEYLRVGDGGLDVVEQQAALWARESVGSWARRSQLTESLMMYVFTHGAALAATSGTGTYVVGVDGRRHHIVQPDAVAALGFRELVRIPWRMLRLLPEGVSLDSQQLRTQVVVPQTTAVSPPVVPPA